MAEGEGRNEVKTKRDPLGGFKGYHGKVLGSEWPPGFRSQTCNPLSPHSMIRHNAVQASRNSTATRDRASESGNLASMGYLGPLSDKPQKVTTHRKPSELRMRKR